MNLLLDPGVSFQLGVIGIIALVLSIMVAVVFFVASIMKYAVAHKYVVLNRIKNEKEITGEMAAKVLIEAKGLEGVTVKRLNWFQSIVYGNSYDVKRKIVRLRGNAYDKSTITAVGLAVQKVGVAMLVEGGDKKAKFRGKIQPFILTAPYFAFPLALVGLAIDLIAQTNSFVLTLVFTGLGLVYYLVALILALFTVPVEKKANNIALEITEGAEFLNEEERGKLEQLFNLYIISYILDIIVSLLYFVKYLFKFIWLLLTSHKN